MFVGHYEQSPFNEPFQVGKLVKHARRYVSQQGAIKRLMEGHKPMLRQAINIQNKDDLTGRTEAIQFSSMLEQRQAARRLTSNKYCC